MLSAEDFGLCSFVLCLDRCASERLASRIRRWRRANCARQSHQVQRSSRTTVKAMDWIALLIRAFASSLLGLHQSQRCDAANGQRHRRNSGRCVVDAGSPGLAAVALCGLVSAASFTLVLSAAEGPLCGEWIENGCTGRTASQLLGVSLICCCHGGERHAMSRTMHKDARVVCSGAAEVCDHDRERRDRVREQLSRIAVPPHCESERCASQRSERRRPEPLRTEPLAGLSRTERTALTLRISHSRALCVPLPLPPQSLLLVACARARSDVAHRLPHTHSRRTSTHSHSAKHPTQLSQYHHGAATATSATVGAEETRQRADAADARSLRCSSRCRRRCATRIVSSSSHLAALSSSACAYACTAASMDEAAAKHPAWSVEASSSATVASSTASPLTSVSLARSSRSISAAAARQCQASQTASLLQPGVCGCGGRGESDSEPSQQQQRAHATDSRDGDGCELTAAAATTVAAAAAARSERVDAHAFCADRTAATASSATTAAASSPSFRLHVPRECRRRRCSC